MLVIMLKYSQPGMFVLLMLKSSGARSAQCSCSRHGDCSKATDQVTSSDLPFAVEAAVRHCVGQVGRGQWGRLAGVWLLRSVSVDPRQ